MTRKMKNRGLEAFIEEGIDGWKLTPHFLPESVVPFANLGLPLAEKNAVKGALNRLARKGKVQKIGRKLFAKVPREFLPQAEIVFERNTNLDQVLNAMVVMEGFIREHRDLIGLIKKIKEI